MLRLELGEFAEILVEQLILLLLDEHSTHTQNIDLINEARFHEVIILCFPLHTTHRFQFSFAVLQVWLLRFGK